MNQKDLGALLIKMGERLRADGANFDSIKAAVSWQYLALSNWDTPEALGTHDTVLAVTAYVKTGGPGDSNPIVGYDITGMLGPDVMEKDVQEVWWRTLE